MSSTTLKIRFTHRLNVSESEWADMIKAAEEQAKLGKVAKFLFNEPSIRSILRARIVRKLGKVGMLLFKSRTGDFLDADYGYQAQNVVRLNGGGFYLEDGEMFLKINYVKPHDLDSAYNFYRKNRLSTKTFPQDRIDETSKRYHSIRSLRPLAFTPSYQFGRIRNEAAFRSALLANDFVAKDIFIQCLPSLELECPFYVLFNSFTIKVGSAGEDDQTSDLFYDAIIDEITPSQGRIEIPRTNDKYFFLKISELLAVKRFPRFQDIRQKLVYMQPDETCLFVSHDWQTPDLPDPHNTRCKELIRLLKSDLIAFYSQKVSYRIGSQLEHMGHGLQGLLLYESPQMTYGYGGTRIFLEHNPLQTNHVNPSIFKYIWYDYSCIPQKPRDHNDEILFREQLVNLNNIFRSKIKTVQIGNKKKQKSRAWCVLEQELAKKNGGINMVFRSQPTKGMAFSNSDAIYSWGVRPMSGTQVSFAEDKKIVEWLLYKSITEALTNKGL